MNTPRALRTSIVLMLISSASAAAQSAPPKPAQFLGAVRVTGTASPLSNVAVTIVDLNLTTQSDTRGRFRLTGIRPGNHVVTLQKIGFVPVRLLVTFGAADSVDVDAQLEQSGQQLDPVSVTSFEPSEWKLEEFETRRAMGMGGRFVTRAEIEANRGRQLPELLAQISGPSLQHSHKSSRVWAYTRRGVTSIMRNGQTHLTEDDILLGANVGTCYTAVIVDAVEAYTGADYQELFDLSSIDVSTLAGVEFYPGGASLPAKYAGLRVACGLLILWTR